VSFQVSFVVSFQGSFDMSNVMCDERSFAMCDEGSDERRIERCFEGSFAMSFRMSNVESFDRSLRRSFLTSLEERADGLFRRCLRPICTAARGPFRKAICGRILAGIGNPSFRPIRIAIPMLICGAIRGGICRGTSTAVWTATSRASCGVRFGAST
jgi:hypothetical protein